MPSRRSSHLSNTRDLHQASHDGQHTTFEFKQSVVSPSYLVALAVGAIEKREIGPRTVVWSEKEVRSSSSLNC